MVISNVKGNPLSIVVHVLAINLSSVSCKVFYCMICAEGLHLSAFHFFGSRAKQLQIHLHTYVHSELSLQ